MDGEVEILIKKKKEFCFFPLIFPTFIDRKSENQIFAASACLILLLFFIFNFKHEIYIYLKKKTLCNTQLIIAFF